MSKAKVGEWGGSAHGTPMRTFLPGREAAAAAWGGGWCVYNIRGHLVASGTEPGDLGKAHADAALCEHGLAPWPCAGCENEAKQGVTGEFGDHRLPLCEACQFTASVERAIYASRTPLLAAWLRASAAKVAPKVAPRPMRVFDITLSNGSMAAALSDEALRDLVAAAFPKPSTVDAPIGVAGAMFRDVHAKAAAMVANAVLGQSPSTAPRCPAGHALTTADAPCATCAEARDRAADARAVVAKADAARRARLADPVVRADLASLPAALRACAGEVERSPLAMMPITTSRAVAARLRALATEVARKQEQDGYVWAGCHYVSDRSYPHERLGLVYAHRIAPSDYVALQLASWAADIPAPTDPWAGWTRTSATDAAKRGGR